MDQLPDRRLRNDPVDLLKQRFRNYSGTLMSVAIGIAAVIFIAWSFDIAEIKYIFPDSSVMNPMSAVCFVSLGIGYFLLFPYRKEKIRATSGYAFALFPVIIGTLRLFDFTWGAHLGIDGILFPNELQSELPGILSNRMAPNTAFNFQLLGLALILGQQLSLVFKRIANYCAILAFLLSTFAIIGYLYDVRSISGYLLYVPMSLQSAIAFFLVSTALLFNNTGLGFMEVLTSPYAGGTISRILIPTALVAPIVIGYLRLNSQRKSPVPEELAVAIIITVIVLLFFLLIFLVSFVINRTDLKRRVAEDTLNILNLELEKKIEQRTHEIFVNEKRYRSLIESSLDGIALLNDKYETVYQSPSATSILGYTLEERQKFKGIDLIYPEDRDQVKRLFSLLMETPGVNHPYLVRMFHKDGRVIWIEGTIRNMLHDDDIHAIVSNYRDITGRKEYETRLAASEQGLRAILESSQDAYVITRRDLSATYQSASAERITGISKEYRLAHPEIRFTHPDDVPELQKQVARLLEHPETPLPFQIRFLHAKGHYIWIEGVMSNLLHDPNVNGLTFHYREITDRKLLEAQQAAAEQRLLALIENISDAIVLNDENSQIIYQSPSVTRILGYGPEERKGKLVLEYVHPEYHDDFKLLYENLKKTPGKPFPFQYRFLHKSGRYIWLEGVVTNLLHDPNVKAYVANYRDITERKDFEEKILSLNSELEERVDLRTKQLQAANKEMEAFTYSVSHDLRAPLRIINGFGQILKEDYSEKIDEDGKKILDRVMTNAKRMGRLIDDLLDFSRIGRTELNVGKINMAKVVSEVIEDLDSSGIEIPVNMFIQDLPGAKGDTNLIKQVWMNLISNAIKYSAKKESPTIEIGSYEDQGKLIYFIKDNGDGFDMQYYSKLFGVFQRLHKETEFTGTGVGLALVQRIILRHGGRVWAESVRGDGATFYFYLPNL